MSPATAPAGTPPPSDSFARYLTDEFTRELSAVMQRGRLLAAADATTPERNDRP